MQGNIVDRRRVVAIVDEACFELFDREGCIQHPRLGRGSVLGDCRYRAGAGKGTGAQTGIKHIADSVAQYIEADDYQKDHQARHDGNMWCREHLRAAFTEHRAKISLWRLRTKTQKAEASRFKDHPACRG